MTERRNPGTSARATSTTTTVAVPDTTCGTGRCGVDEVCVCQFYADWKCHWAAPQDVATQLRRRRAAAMRSPRLACGRRDPISAVMW